MFRRITVFCSSISCAVERSAPIRSRFGCVHNQVEVSSYGDSSNAIIKLSGVHVSHSTDFEDRSEAMLLFSLNQAGTNQVKLDIIYLYIQYNVTANKTTMDT